jgi:hypothetical protein
LKEFCNYTIECYKKDQKANAVGLKMTKDEVIDMLNKMKLPDEMKKHRLAIAEKQDKDGYFDKRKLNDLYSDFRSVEDNDFWKYCTIDSYKYMETENWRGYEMAEPIVVLRNGDYTTMFKIGELIKTKNGWKIIDWSSWK